MTDLTGMNTVDVVILCGGKGTRLREVVHDRPKPMAEIQGRPFLDILITYVSNFGLKRFILCTGHMGDYIETVYRRPDAERLFVFSKEETPLGTAGALKNAEQHIQSNPFLVMNGDSFCPIKIDELLETHARNGAIATMAVSQIDDAGDFGSITMDARGRITAFREKVPTRNRLINAGVYVMDRKVLSLIPPGVPTSLENDVFPGLIEQDFYGYRAAGPVIDIGTPERYELAKQLL